jgi:hypothetical protein
LPLIWTELRYCSALVSCRLVNGKNTAATKKFSDDAYGIIIIIMVQGHATCNAWQWQIQENGGGRQRPAGSTPSTGFHVEFEYADSELQFWNMVNTLAYTVQFQNLFFYVKKSFSKYGYVGIVQDPTAGPSTYLDYYSYVVNLGTRWLLGSYSLP